LGPLTLVCCGFTTSGLPVLHTLTVMEPGYVIVVRPTIVARIVYLPLYVFAPTIAGVPVYLVTAPIFFLVTGRWTGRIHPVALAFVFLAWAALTIVAARWIHRVVGFFVDRATLALTAENLYLGRTMVPVAIGEIREAYFAGKRFLRGYRTANRRAYNTLLLVLDDGSFVPLSPPPGTFVGEEPAMPAATSNVGLFMRTLTAMVEPVLREDKPLPPAALPYLHPAEANRLHHPSKPPPRTLRWRLARLTWM
jgi:hypothetical protein